MNTKTLARIRECGIQLEMDGEHLIIRTSRHALTPERRAYLDVHRDELVALLRTEAVGSPSMQDAATAPTAL